MGRSLIIGEGEVGNALKEVLSKAHEVETKDLAEKEFKPEPDVMHVCVNYVGMGWDKFQEVVAGYRDKYKPKLIDICSTVRPGATARFGNRACHSTTRGLHPHLAEGLRTITKHIGGPNAPLLARYYAAAGVKTSVHRKAATTEAAHIAHLIGYGVQLMCADSLQRLCREAGTDYLESVVKYVMTGNEGFRALDMASKSRMVLTPPNGRIGGHCVVQAAQVALEMGLSDPLIILLANYNKGR